MNEHINNKLYKKHQKTFPNYNSELDYNDKKIIHNELDKIEYKHKRKSFSNLNELDNKIENKHKHRKTYPNQISENSILDNQYIKEYISIKKYDNNKLVTFIEFICTLDDNGNVVYNNDYFSNDIILPKEDIVEYQSESSLSEKIDSLHKKVDLILDYLTKKL